MTPLVVGPSELRSEYMGMGVDGEVADEATERGYSVTVGEETVDSSIPFAAEGGIRKVLTMYVLTMYDSGICLKHPKVD